MASTKTETSTTWVTPDTFVAGQLVTAQHMNTMRDNFLALKTPANFKCYIDEAADYTTSSTSFVDVDTTNAELTATITTAGGAVMLSFSGMCSQSNANGRIYFDITVDGVALAGNDGIFGAIPSGVNEAYTASFTVVTDVLAAGSHTFVLQWKTSAATATLSAGAGTSNRDTHPIFWGKEIA